MSFTKASLKERGWTESLIQKYLKEPDQHVPNFRHRGGPPICHYDAQRVLAAENTEDFRADKLKAETRKAASRAAAERRRHQTMLYAESTPITLPTIEWHKLVDSACESYNQHHESGDFATPGSNPDFLERIAVNFLRHECTTYESELNQISGMVGANDARMTLRTRILEAIADSYPDLACECNRQMKNTFDR